MSNSDLLWLAESNNIEDVYDADSLAQAVMAWDYLCTQTKLTHQNVLKAHKILMLHQKLRPNEKGYLRRQNVRVGSYVAPKWETVCTKFDAWIYMVNASLAMQLGIKDDFVENYETRLNEAYFHHMEFEGIHPFIDGNGRIGRMLLNWELRQMGMDAEVIYADKRAEYYAMFDRHRGLYDNTGNKTK